MFERTSQSFVLGIQKSVPLYFLYPVDPNIYSDSYATPVNMKELLDGHIRQSSVIIWSDLFQFWQLILHFVLHACFLNYVCSFLRKLAGCQHPVKIYLLSRHLLLRGQCSHSPWWSRSWTTSRRPLSRVAKQAIWTWWSRPWRLEWMWTAPKAGGWEGRWDTDTQKCGRFCWRTQWLTLTWWTSLDYLPSIQRVGRTG